ncbi:MAG: hypothetical protein K2X74_00505 [Acetobacteraceae bacterium]|nr:hypothetical protein [Acetobacteraceae bacterium]
MMEMDDIGARLPRFSPEAEGELLAGRRPGLGEFLGGAVGEGWWNTTLGVGGAVGEAAAEGERDPRPIAREEWRYHPLWRENIAWDERMTEGRAEAQARVFDRNRYRRAMMEARDPGVLESVLGFGGMLVGSIPDPVNFIPIAGPVARLGRAAGAAGVAARLEAPGVAAAALRGTVDAVGGNVLAAPLVYAGQERFGDEITFDRVLTDLVLGAVIGAGFGTAGGLLARARETMDARTSARIVEAAAADVAAGRTPDLPQALLRRTVEDAVVRAAPDGARNFIGPEEAPLSGLPARTDGSPLTADEWRAAWMDRNGVPEAVAAAQGAADQAAKADTLVGWLVRNGGVRNDGGEMLEAAGGFRARPGLINNQPRRRTPDDTAWIGGMSPDDAARAAREAGFFPDRAAGDGVDPLTPDDLWRAVDEEVRGLSVRRPDEVGSQPPPDRNIGERMTREAEAAADEAYPWYREAVAVEARLKALPASVREAVSERAAVLEFDAGMSREEATARAGRDLGGSEDPELAAALRDIEALRAEGRLGAADEAIIRAGDERAAELTAAANGMEGAAACMMRTAA